MKHRTRAIAYLQVMAEDGSRNIILPIAVSIICHLLFFTILILVPGVKPANRSSYSVIHVNMVSPPAKGRPSGTKTRVAAKQEPVKQESKKGVTFRTREASPSKTAKKSISRKSAKAPVDVKEAIKEIKDTVETSRSREVSDAVERIRGEVEETETNRRSIQEADKELYGVESGVPGGRGMGGGNAPLDVLTLYMFEIRDMVQQHWAYSESLAGAKPDLETLLVFEVLPNGEIRDIRFTEKSGNRYLDESAHKAVIKASPFPPYPKTLSRPVVEVPLRFTPRGVQQ